MANDDSFLSNKHFLPPAQSMIQGSTLHQGANFHLPNDLQHTIAMNEKVFLPALESAVIGDRDENGTLKGNGLLGRAMTEEANQSYIDKTNENIDKAKQERDNAIRNAIGNIDSIAFNKKNNDITKATGIPDADNAIQEYNNILQSMGFNNLEHFSEVYSAFTSGNIPQGSPRYTQLKNLFAKNDKFINGALGIQSAIQNYNRRVTNPLTQQDRIELAQEGLQSGYYQNVDGALNDLALRDSAMANSLKAQAEMKQKANVLYLEQQGGGVGRSSGGYSGRGYGEGSYSARGTISSNNTNPNELLPELQNNQEQQPDIQLNKDLLKSYNFLPSKSDMENMNKSLSLFGNNSSPITSRFLRDIDATQYLEESGNPDDVNSVENMFRNPINQFGLQDKTNNLVNSMAEYEKLAKLYQDSTNKGQLPPDDINILAQMAQNIKTQLNNYEKDLEVKQKEIEQTNNKQTLKEFNTFNENAKKAIENVRKNYSKVWETFDKNNKNFLPEQQGNNQQSEEQIFYKNLEKDLEKGMSLQTLIDKAGTTQGTKDTPPMATIEAQAIQEIKDIADKDMEFIDNLVKEHKLKNQSGITAYKALGAYLKDLLQNDTYNTFMANIAQNKLPTESELRSLDKEDAGKVAEEISKTFEGRGELLYADGTPVRYGDFVNQLRDFLLYNAKHNKGNTNIPEYYAKIHCYKINLGIGGTKQFSNTRRLGQK